MNDPNRKKELAKIHVAKKDLCLDDATYRSVLWTVARVRSAADLDAHGRGAVLEHFRSRGWQPKKSKRAGKAPHNLDKNGMLGKIEALLADQKLPWSYADALAQRMYKTDRVAWCSGAALRGIVAALAKRARKGNAADA